MSFHTTDAQVVWKETEEGLIPYLNGERLAWAPQPGSQVAFLQCPVQEILYEGTRGPGKTAALLAKYYMQVGKGYGAEWRGIIFRRSFPELRDIIEKSRAFFAEACPAAKYNQSDHVWTFPEGEKLWFAHFEKPDDYWSYHGHAYPFQGWEELCTWPTDECLKSMLSCLRSTVPGIPKQVLATANPYGVGHNWVKARYGLPVNRGMFGPLLRDSDGERIAIHGELRENKVLLFADPDYIKRLKAAARNEAELRAWLYGDWNIVAGGMFDDLWTPGVHIVPNVPLHLIPKLWRIDRAYDHGQSKPFSVGWWAESNGEPFEHDGVVYGQVRGDLYRIAEWYGCRKGKPNEGLRLLSTDIGRGIKELEENWKLSGRVRIGPADSSIFDPYEGTKSVAGDMRRHGILWDPADKSPGSRRQGWQQIRKLLSGALPAPDGPREQPGLFTFDRCRDFTRTMPVLPRSSKDLDDVDTDAEDHIGDETRYRVRRRDREVKTGAFK